MNDSTVVVREVAREISQKNSALVIEICRPMNGDSLDGIEDWSHCWIIFLTVDQSVDMLLFSILSRIGDRSLELMAIDSKPIPAGARIIDIKPFHLVDNSIG